MFTAEGTHNIVQKHVTHLSPLVPHVIYHQWPKMILSTIQLHLVQNNERVNKFHYLGVTWRSKGQEVGIKRKHWLKLKDIELLQLHTMHITNPNIKDSDVREHIRNGMWIKDYVWNWGEPKYKRYSCQRTYVKWYVNQRLCMELRWEDWVRHGKNDTRFTEILQEINEYTELCSQWTCWDGTWQRDEQTQAHRTDCKILVLDYVFGYRRSGKKKLWMAEK